MSTLQLKRPFLYFGEDMLTLTLTLFVSKYLFGNFRISKFEWFLLSGFTLLWLLAEHRHKLFNPSHKNEFNLHISDRVKAYTALIVLSFAAYSLFPIPALNRSGVTAIIVGFPLLDIAISFLLVKLVMLYKNSKGQVKYTLVAGIGEVAKNVETQMEFNSKSRYQVKGFINCSKKEVCVVEQDKILGSLDDMHQYLKENPVDEIVIALPVKRSKKLQRIVSAADYHGIRVKCIIDYRGVFGDNYKITRYGQIDAVNIRQLPIDGVFSSLVKNTFDKIFSLLVLTLLSPLFFLLAALIKLDSPGPVFYCPTRVGRNGKSFRLFKFRSMRQNDEATGGVLSTKENDPRVTRLGKILRKYSLDELPQFINVFLGNMSVVGPRPHRKFLDQQFQESVDKYMIRHYVKPGITGWAQVNGWRGPTVTGEQKAQRTAYDLWYLENWSLWLDIKIIYRTVFSKKAHKNAY
jgi:Undecaprenyl-phosphate glucose phosphotransferase